MIRFAEFEIVKFLKKLKNMKIKQSQNQIFIILAVLR